MAQERTIGLRLLLAEARLRQAEAATTAVQAHREVHMTTPAVLHATVQVHREATPTAVTIGAAQAVHHTTAAAAQAVRHTAEEAAVQAAAAEVRHAEEDGKLRTVLNSSRYNQSTSKNNML